jgi:hypothetical protein
MIENIWKKYNVSLVLILPIFQKIIQNITNRYNQKFSIQGLLLENGLINTYLYDYKGYFNGTLKLKFDAEKILDCKLQSKVKNPITNLLDILINNQYFKNVIHRQEYIIIELTIPDEFLEDIQKIENSKYSKVSVNYKKEIEYKGNYILTNDDLVNYLYIENLPAKITGKKKSLEDDILKIFNAQIDLNEVYIEFDKTKECLGKI